MVGASAWSRSEGLSAVAARDVPGSVNSNVRLAAPLIFFNRAAGARLWDVDGNDYVDHILGQGPSFLGHAPTRINDEVADAVSRGNLYAGQHPDEIDAAAAMLSAIGWADMIRFGMTGTECVQAALRVARAFTGRERFVRFEGHYHGWIDNVLVAIEDGKPVPASRGQLASHLADSEMLPWNDLAALEALLRDRPTEFAAVIMEPIMVNSGSIEPRPGYLEGVRELCTRYGVVLIFDEVITGFRVSRGGAAGLYGITPDLATYGKAMAGGWPVAALAGRRDIMELFGTGAVNHSGTFNASVMATSAVLATLKELESDDVYTRVEEYSGQLQDLLARLARDHGVPLHIQGPPAALHVGFGSPDPVLDYRQMQTLDLAGYAAFSRLLARNGIWAAARGTWYVSAAHGAAELADTETRFERALEELRA